VATPTVTHPASTAAAVASAAHGVLIARIPAQASSIESQYADYLNSIPDGAATTNGVAVGEQVAEAILAWRASDGFDNDIPYEQLAPGSGVFESVLPTPPVDVKLKQVRPLTMASDVQFRPGPPNALTSPQYAADLNELKTYGGAESKVRMPDQTDIALFWSDNSAVQWPQTLRGLAVQRGLNVSDTARMLTLMHVAVADAILACFDAKYHYLFWRPFHAIPRADTDGNPATEADPSWLPLLYPNHPNHPEYPAAHGCWTTAVTRTMSDFFGTDEIAFTVQTNLDNVSNKTRNYARFSDAATEVYNARVWGGLHFRSSTTTGALIGDEVAQYVFQNFFQPDAVTGANGP
jgi:hypothetical protein